MHNSTILTPLGVLRNGRKPKHKRLVCFGVCRDCQYEQATQARFFLHASPPRCLACGGLLEQTWKRDQSKQRST